MDFRANVGGLACCGADPGLLLSRPMGVVRVAGRAGSLCFPVVVSCDWQATIGNPGAPGNSLGYIRNLPAAGRVDNDGHANLRTPMAAATDAVSASPVPHVRRAGGRFTRSKSIENALLALARLVRSLGGRDVLRAATNLSFVVAPGGEGHSLARSVGRGV